MPCGMTPITNVGHTAARNQMLQHCGAPSCWRSVTSSRSWPSTHRGQFSRGRVRIRSVLSGPIVVEGKGRAADGGGSYGWGSCGSPWITLWTSADLVQPAAGLLHDTSSASCRRGDGRISRTKTTHANVLTEQPCDAGPFGRKPPSSTLKDAQKQSGLLLQCSEQSEGSTNCLSALNTWRTPHRVVVPLQKDWARAALPSALQQLEALRLRARGWR